MYYNPNNQSEKNPKSFIYVAKKLGTIQDEALRQIVQYDTPKKYRFNVQPLSGESEIRTFGELSKSMKVAVITNKQKYTNEFKEFDLAYLDGVTPDGEIDNGDNANYRIYEVRNQNTIIRVYFLKLVKNQE